MDKWAEAWLRGTARREHWRLKATCDIAELVQDGFLIYHRIALRYPDTNPRHRMALFQTAFGRHIVSLTRKQARFPECHLADDIDLDLTAIPQDEPAPNIDEAPAAVRDLVDACSARPHRLRSVPRRCSPDGTREATHEWLSRVFGYNVPADAHLQLRSFMRR